jgi:GntR family transcriptional regulator
MKNRLERDSPLPLYHQIAAALRNAIAVGELEPGERLPAIREAGQRWGVNLHTVRRAYGVLAEEGLVRVDGARGTTVAVRRAEARGTRELDAFLEECADAGRERFGLERMQLAQLLLRGFRVEGPPAVHVVECSQAQALGHCEELMQKWRVDARPLVLAEIDELPIGPLVGTYFHYNDIHQRWPGRLDEVFFVAIAPDPDLMDRLAEGVTDGVGARRLWVCEFDEGKARNIVADLKAMVPPGQYEIEPRVLSSAAALPVAGAGEAVLVAPRVWSDLGEAQRSTAVQIRYTIRARELESLGATYGWERTTEAT